MAVFSNMQAVRAAYRAFADGDLDAFVRSLDPAFLSGQSAAVPWIGVCRGRHGVREMFGKVAERARATYQPEEFIEADDRIVVLGQARITPRRTGEEAQVRELHV
ncbi:nuclear transport factor 2 family protein [Nonomuraea polychroma]|uniref:nuclear transport factor 2 family protein n=1 Tax=Nonomuraea polychroma TaxID=46176 RepID=UPI003D8A82DA